MKIIITPTEIQSNAVLPEYRRAPIKTQIRPRMIWIILGKPFFVFCIVLFYYTTLNIQRYVDNQSPPPAVKAGGGAD